MYSESLTEVECLGWFRLKLGVRKAVSLHILSCGEDPTVFVKFHLTLGRDPNKATDCVGTTPFSCSELRQFQLIRGRPDDMLAQIAGRYSLRALLNFPEPTPDHGYLYLKFGEAGRGLLLKGRTNGQFAQFFEPRRFQ